jgi:hypothetical protein
MPITVYYQNDDQQGCTIRPVPLVSIGTNILKNGAGEAFGVTYSITLTGTILADQGTPFAYDPAGSIYDLYSPIAGTLVGPYDSFSNAYLTGNPPKQQIDNNSASHSIFFKQKALRALFAQDGQRIEIVDWEGNEASIICYPRTTEISFSEGIYVEKCDYTITLECDTILRGDDPNSYVDDEGSLIVDGTIRTGKTENELLVALSGAFITDFSEDWSIEVDEAQGESPSTPRSYRISHNINATGKTHYGPDGKQKAWEQARKFVQQRLSNSINDYPNVMGKIGSGTINLIDSYGGYNHVRSENISESAGTYSVTENWLIASGNAYENYNLSISSSTDNPFVNVSIDGNIKGLTSISPSGFGTGVGVSAYDNALGKYNQITNSGIFGLTSDIYKRANNAVAVQLNSQPTSISLGTNQYTGEVTYNLQFNNRPTNYVSGTLAEAISVNDTYPGDVFAVIPVIGRATGPILQYVGGRTEYRRDIGINLTMDYTKIPYAVSRNPLLLKKPSIVEPMATQIATIINELSPAQEPGIRKYFVSPPQETWNPKEGTYSFNMSWTYELDR